MKDSMFSARPYWLISILLLVVLALTACQPAAQPTEAPMEPTEPAVSSPTAEPTMAPTEPMATEEAGVPATGSDGVRIEVADNPEFGPILVDGEGMTLYMFTRDEPNVSNCEGQCLEAWPPLIADNGVTAGEGVDESLIGEADLPDGRKIVTYNGMPLYYWINDQAPGDTTGQGVNDVWFVVSPEGEMIDSPMSSGEGGVVLDVATDPALGEYLVDGEGMTLYMFTRDEPDTVNCQDQCLENWPPFISDGNVQAGEGVNADLIGEADLPDGRKIVTYNSMPLYYWVNDSEPGDTTGQGVNDVWWVVSPAGDPIQGMSSGDTGMMEEGGVVLEVATDPSLGEFLVDGEGMTLYMFTRDEPNTVNCQDQCLENWPPFISDGNVQAGEGVDADLIGEADLPDGQKIVTYNGMPLYYWVNDKEPGDTTGQAVNDVWWVVSPAGEPVGAPMPASDGGGYAPDY